MQLNNLTLFRQMEQKMHWLSTRQSVLAENVANADTPAYTPRDLKPFTGASSTQLAAPLIMASTDGGAYMSGSNGASMIPVVQKDREAVETSPNGNQVSLEDQLTKVGETGMDYQMLTNLYRKQLSMMKTALGRNTTA